MAGLRNFVIINSLLDKNELTHIYSEGVVERYIWNEDGENVKIDEVMAEKQLSVINIENTNIIDILKCNTSQNISTISESVFRKVAK